MLCEVIVTKLHLLSHGEMRTMKESASDMKQTVCGLVLESCVTCGSPSVVHRQPAPGSCSNTGVLDWRVGTRCSLNGNYKVTAALGLDTLPLAQLLKIANLVCLWVFLYVEFGVVFTPRIAEHLKSFCRAEESSNTVARWLFLKGKVWYFSGPHEE